MGHTVNRVKCQVKIGWQTVAGDWAMKLVLTDSQGLSVYIGPEEFYSRSLNFSRCAGYIVSKIYPVYEMTIYNCAYI